MRYLVFSDIHGNLEALEAVLEHASRKKSTTIFSSATWWATEPPPTRSSRKSYP